MNATTFHGRYCEGKGNPAYLELIEKSIAMFHPQEKLPFFQMLYNPVHKTFREGFMWGAGWWIQNSFGFAKNAAAFLTPHWLTILQNSYDLFWDRIGDGKRIGADDGISEGKNYYYSLQAPDGALGDVVMPDVCIIYKQGDGKVPLHDWFYETTAAQLLIQSDIILREHSVEMAKKYIPLMERSIAFIERARDPRNNLFLVGPACNLLSPSYGGGFNEETGEMEKGYLTGLSVTYAAALHQYKEVLLLVGEQKKHDEIAHLEQITKQSLNLLLTDEKYLVKSMDQSGKKHGVYGADKYGYFDGVTNIDALAWGVLPKEIEQAVYQKLSEVNIRPFDFIMNNTPTLDDTYYDYLGEPLSGFFKLGDWVNGGCWGTVEGRAMLAYSKLHQYEDIARVVDRSMKWAEDFRMDAPFSQSGENTYNPWSDRTDKSEVSVMVDNFAIPAGMLRGIFGFEYHSDSVEIGVNLPQNIESYQQKLPFYFGGKRVFLSAVGSGSIRKVFCNGQLLAVHSGETATLTYNELPQEAYIELICIDNGASAYEQFREKCKPNPESIELSAWAEELTPAMKAYYEKYRGSAELQQPDSIRREVFAMMRAYVMKKQGQAATKHFRPLTKTKSAQIIELFEKTIDMQINV